MEKTTQQEPTPEPVTGTGDGTDKIYTQAELDQEGDRRAQAAADTAMRKADEKAQVRLEAAEKKATDARLAEEGKFKELHEKSQAELDAMKAENAVAVLKADTATMLNEAGLDEFAPVFDRDTSTLDGRKATAETFKKLVDAGIEKGINERLGTNVPPKGQTPQAAGDLATRIKAVEAKGDWATSIALKAQTTLTPAT